MQGGGSPCPLSSTSQTCAPASNIVVDSRDRAAMVKRSPYFSLALIFLTLLSHAEAQAIECKGVKPVEGELGYRLRQQSERCEGLYAASVAGEALSVISLTSAEISYQIASDKHLLVAAPPLSGLSQGPINVQANSIRPGMYFYRMETTVRPEESARWPLEPVLSQLKLPANSLGVLGWVQSGPSKTYVPVSVRSQQPAKIDWQNLVLVLRPNIPVKQVQWRLRRADGSIQASPPQVISRYFGSGEPIRLPVGGRQAGLWLADINATPESSDSPVTLFVRLYVP